MDDADRAMATNEDNAMERAVEAVGVGKFHAVLLSLTSVLLAADAGEMMLLSFVGPSVRCEWDLTAYQTAVLSLAVFFGLFVGAFVWGFLADSYGRKFTLRGLICVTLVLASLSAAAQSYPALLASRASVGFALGGFGVAFGYFVEWMPTRLRSKNSIILMGMWTLGVLFSASVGFATLVPHGNSKPVGWRALVLISSSPLLIPLWGVFCVLPESPRWLVAKGRREDARDALLYAARMNDRDAAVVAISLPPSPTPPLTSSKPAAANFFAIALSLKHRRTFLAMLLIWFLVSFVYYGLVLTTSSLGSNDRGFDCGEFGTPFEATDFVNVFASSAAEFPGLIFALVASERVGRKPTLWSSFAAAAASLLLFAWSKVSFFLWSARAFINAAFVICWIFTQELFPTTVRSTAFGVCNAWSRLGGMATSLVAQQTLENRGLRFVVLVYAFSAAAGGALTFAISRETRGAPLEQS